MRCGGLAAKASGCGEKKSDRMPPVGKPELKTLPEVTAPDARQVPKTAIAVTLSGILILLAVLMARPAKITLAFRL